MTGFPKEAEKVWQNVNFGLQQVSMALDTTATIACAFECAMDADPTGVSQSACNLARNVVCAKLKFAHLMTAKVSDVETSKT